MEILLPRENHVGIRGCGMYSSSQLHSFYLMSRCVLFCVVSLSFASTDDRVYPRSSDNNMYKTIVFFHMGLCLGRCLSLSSLSVVVIKVGMKILFCFFLQR